MFYKAFHDLAPLTLCIGVTLAFFQLLKQDMLPPATGPLSILSPPPGMLAVSLNPLQNKFCSSFRFQLKYQFSSEACSGLPLASPDHGPEYMLSSNYIPSLQSS